MYIGGMQSLEQEPDFLNSGGFYAELHTAQTMPEAHWHDHVELNFLLSGAMTYLFNGNRVTLNKHCIYCFWAVVPHQVIAVDEPAELVCAYIPFVEFLALALPDDFKSGILNGKVLTGSAADPIDPLLFARWAQEWRQGGNEGLQQILREEARLQLRRLSLHAIPANITENSGPKIDFAKSGLGKMKADDRLIDRVQKMTNFINQEFGGPIQVADIAVAGGLHPTNAMTAFKRVLGLSIAQYIRRQRLSHAMMMLADTDKPIIEIAFACGYGSLSRFYNAFQLQLEKTPRDYRLQFRK